jgi:hypothetical protein
MTGSLAEPRAGDQTFEVQAVFTRDGRIWSERLNLRIRAQQGWLQAKT